MITSPELVKFETPTDLVDYVTRGLPPMKDDFNNFMRSMKSPDDWDVALQKQGKEVTVPIAVFNGWSKSEIDTLYNTLDRVYANRIRNRNIACGVLAAAAVTGVVIAIAK